jgi:hypothetical protein
MSAKSNSIDHLKSEVDGLRRQVNEQEVRLTLAQAWVNFLRFAYDALLHHEVNYKILKEVKDTRTLDEAEDLPVTAARNVIAEYLGRCQNAIKAAIRRKNFKVH